MNSRVSWKWAWAFFSLLLLTTLQQNHAESESITEPFHNRVFQWKKKHQTETQEQGLTLDLKTILAGALSFAGASISSAGGLGGGGLFVPILNLVAGLDLKTATAVSAFMVTGGSLANAIYCFSAKIPGSKHKPLVDYDIALLSEPCMLLGVSLGVICNVMCPEWLISLLLAVFLACSTFLTCRSGFRCWGTETCIAVALEVERRERGNGFSNLIEDIEKEGCSGIDEVGDSMKVPLLEKKTEESFGFFPWRKLGILVLIWLCFFLLHVLQGDHGRKGLISIEPCSIGYWLLSAIQIPLALGFTAWILKQKDWYESYHTEQPKVTVVGERKEGWARLVFPVVALLSGILGGLFGIGGGMLINPVLLQMRVPPQITAATSSFMVLFSSSMSAVQYLLLGMKRLDYAFLFSVICFSSSLIGLALIQTAIARYGRASLIVFSVGTVMALSAILVTSFGALDVWRDYTTGQYMGFRLPC